MELKVEIGFDQLMNAIKQLPAAKLKQLKAELSEQTLTETMSRKNIQHLLLNGPVMSDVQYEDYKAIRDRLNKWRTK